MCLARERNVLAVPAAVGPTFYKINCIGRRGRRGYKYMQEYVRKTKIG